MGVINIGTMMKWVLSCCLTLAFLNSLMATLQAAGGGAQMKVPLSMIGTE